MTVSFIEGENRHTSAGNWQNLSHIAWKSNL